MFVLALLMQYVVPTLALVAAGAYLEHRFGAAVSARVSSTEARLASLEAKAKIDTALAEARVRYAANGEKP